MQVESGSSAFSGMMDAQLGRGQCIRMNPRLNCHVKTVLSRASSK